MENGINFKVSDEIGKLITNKWVLSISPVLVPTDENNPYSCMNQKKTAMQLRLAEIGGERVVFNLTWAQMDALKRAVNKAQENATMEKNQKMSPFYWDIKDACGDDNFLRIFGEPDKDGLCPVRILSIKRNPLKKNQESGKIEFAKSPWQILIQSGRGVKLKYQTGGFYMKEKTFIEDKRCFAYLSDGHMKDLMYWSDYFMEVINGSVKSAVLKGYSALQAQKLNAQKNKQY